MIDYRDDSLAIPNKVPDRTALPSQWARPNPEHPYRASDFVHWQIASLRWSLRSSKRALWHAPRDFFHRVSVALGDIDGKPFSVAKIADYMSVPRTTVIRRLDQLQSWGLIDRRGRHCHVREKKLNSLIGMQSYQQVRRILCEGTKKLSVLDTLPG